MQENKYFDTNNIVHYETQYNGKRKRNKRFRYILLKLKNAEKNLKYRAIELIHKRSWSSLQAPLGKIETFKPSINLIQRRESWPSDNEMKIGWI
jgi:hypothetical protein